MSDDRRMARRGSVMRSVVRPVGALLALTGACLGEPAAVNHYLPLETPIRLGGDRIADACSSKGAVVGMNPAKDGFLSVRAGPGSRYRAIDRLVAAQSVWICRESGKWLGIVYEKQADEQCGVATPWPSEAPYEGPCRAGWVHSRYIKGVAG